MEELADKVCVVTGGASGLGLAMARRFHDAGMAVCLLDVEEGPLDAAASELGERGGAGVLALTADVRSAGEMAEARDRAVDRFGAVHVVCLNAGVAAIGPLLDTSLDTWRWLLDVNVLGVVTGLHAFGPLLVAQGEGHVVCTASAAGLITSPALGAYSATKHAVVGLAATLRDELAPSGVGVSVLCPGMVNTRIFESERNRPAEYGEGAHADEETAGHYRSLLAGGVSPDDVAAAVHEAVLTGRFFVLPSPELDPLVRARVDEVAAALER